MIETKPSTHKTPFKAFLSVYVAFLPQKLVLFFKRKMGREPGTKFKSAHSASFGGFKPNFIGYIGE